MSKLVQFRKPRIRISPKGVRVTRPSARIGGKVGVNISSRGVSASARTKMGTISTGRAGGRSSKNRRVGCMPILLSVASLPLAALLVQLLT